jgi:hypothetical protein
MKSSSHHRRALSLCALVSLALAVGAPTTHANEPLTSFDFNDFIDAAAPVFFFAKGVNNVSCFPEDALPNGSPHAAADREAWPHTSKGCAGPGSNFLVYVSVRACSDDDILTSYTLYYPKDGFAGSSGHAHDFEYVAVGWKRIDNNFWRRDRLMMSVHGEIHGVTDWNKVNTIGFVNAQGQEMPRIYAAWAKHAMFNDEGGLTDILSQLGGPFWGNNYRHGDFAAWPGKRINVGETHPGNYEMRLVEPNNSLYNAFKANAAAFGAANSNPAVNYDRLCDIRINTTIPHPKPAPPQQGPKGP